MTKVNIRQLHRLCARVEALQGQLLRSRQKNDRSRRVYEAVADAKNRLLDALRNVE